MITKPVVSTGVQKQLEKICSSKEFKSKKLLCDMLTYLVNEHLAGRSKFIKGYTIATEVFGRDEDFDPDQNSLVRIHAGRLRRQLRLYYLDTGKDDGIIIEIPKGRYIPLISTNDTDSKIIQKESSVGSKPRKPTISVLPFKNLSQNPEYDYIAAGLHLEMMELLSRYDEFSVIGINLPLEEIQSDKPFVDKVNQKGIGFLIDGSIQEFDKLLLIRLRVIDVRENSQIWADKFKFDRENNNLIDQLEKLITKAANYIGSEYGVINLRRQRRLAYDKPSSILEQDLILKYYHTANVLSEEVAIDFHKSVFEALEQKPDSAIINCLAGDIFSRIYTLDFPGAEMAYDKMAYHLEKAYSLDPNHQRIICSLLVKLFIFDEKERFMQLLNKYKDIVPKSPLRLGAFALFACLFGEWKTGLKMLDEVFEYNFNVPGYFYGLLASYHYKQKEYERALEGARKYQMPGVYWAPFYRAITYAQTGQLVEAEKEVEALLAIRPDFASKGRYLLGIMIKDDALLEHMVEGLEKAGLKLA